MDNFPKMKYIKNLQKLKNNENITDNKNEKNIKNEEEQKINQIIVEAKLLLVKKRFDEAKKLLLDNGLIQEAMDAFKDIHKYIDAIEIAEQYKLPESELMKKEYLNWLVANEMYDEIAKIKIKEGAFIEAVKSYIKGDMQIKAVNLIIKYRIPIDNNTMIYLMNSINELGLTDIATKLNNYIKEIQ